MKSGGKARVDARKIANHHDYHPSRSLQGSRQTPQTPALHPLLKRLPFTRSSLPVFTHVAAHAEGDTVTLAVATLDQRLETRIPLAEPIAHLNRSSSRPLPCARP